MTRGKLLAIGVAVLAAGLMFFLWPRHQPSPEEVIKAKVVEMARAAEKKDASTIMDNVSQSFKAPGLGDRDALKGLIVFNVMQGQWVRVFVVSVKVNVTSPTTAEMQGKFVLGRSEAAKVEDLGKSSDLSAQRIDATWVKESDGEWRVTSATHRDMNPAEMLP